MPPKKRKRKQPTQSQRQSQKVIVNIGSKSAPRKRSGRGGLPPPSHQHNLAPTFVTAPQVDYTPILAMLTQQTRSLQPEPVRNPVTPLSAVMATQTAEQMAGEVAQRRAGPTAANFQPPPSEARMRVEPEPSGDIVSALKKTRPQPSVPKVSVKAKMERRSMGAEDIDVPLMISSEPKGKPVTFTPTEKKERKDFKPITKYRKPIDQLPSQKQFKSSEKVRERAKQQTVERALRLEAIKEKAEKDPGSITRAEKLFVSKTKGTKKLKKALGIEGLMPVDFN